MGSTQEARDTEESTIATYLTFSTGITINNSNDYSS